MRRVRGRGKARERQGKTSSTAWPPVGRVRVHAWFHDTWAGCWLLVAVLLVAVVGCQLSVVCDDEPRTTDNRQLTTGPATQQHSNQQPSTPPFDARSGI